MQVRTPRPPGVSIFHWSAAGSRLRDHGAGDLTARKGAGGFTLVELLIAVMFLSVGVLAMAQVFAAADRHAAHSREETIAVALIQEIREKIMSETYADIMSIFNGVDTASSGSISLPASEWAQHVTQRLGTSGRGRIQVWNHASEPSLADGLLDVRITVSWREGSHTITFPLRFLIAKIGA
jgi:Tfp pilus assembly protein PilV